MRQLCECDKVVAKPNIPCFGADNAGTHTCFILWRNPGGLAGSPLRAASISPPLSPLLFHLFAIIYSSPSPTLFSLSHNLITLILFHIYICCSPAHELSLQHSYPNGYRHKQPMDMGGRVCIHNTMHMHVHAYKMYTVKYTHSEHQYSQLKSARRAARRATRNLRSKMFSEIRYSSRLRRLFSRLGLANVQSRDIRRKIGVSHQFMGP